MPRLKQLPGIKLGPRQWRISSEALRKFLAREIAPDPTTPKPATGEDIEHHHKNGTKPGKKANSK